MTLDALAFEPQFFDHLAPVWLALPDAIRGRFLVDPSVVMRARARGIEVVSQPRPTHVPAYPDPRHDGPPALVASYGDVKEGRRLGYGPFAFMEHGAGQSYGNLRNGSYAGGPDRADNELILVPNAYCAERWTTAYPGARVEIVGCPKLDELPGREYSIGVDSHAWQDFAAVIRTHLRTSALTERNEPVCVAHAIADVSPIGRELGSSPVTPAKPSTTDGDTSLADQTQPTDQHDPAPLSTALVRSAMSECTGSSASDCLGRATSAGRPIDWRSLSVGTRLTNTGGSARKGSPTLSIPTTTFGSVSLAMPTTTGRAAMSAPAAPPVVCISFHWPAPLSISGYAGTALGDFLPVLSTVARRFQTIGHCHPKGDWPVRMQRQYQRLGIPFVADFEDVCRQADVYVCDNSSTLFEFASTGRPVVVLNAQAWHRQGGPGLRFWDAADVGPNVWPADDLVGAIERALELRPEDVAAREAALDIVYPVRSGGARLAADAIVSWLRGRQSVAA